MRDERGSITVAAAIILSSIIILNLVLYDYAKMKTVISCLPDRAKLACNSVLASYDALLAEKYNLYGYNTGSGHSAHKDFLKYYGNVDCEVNLKNKFTQPEIIENQICDIMKIKTPVSVTETVLEALNIISAADESCDENSKCAKAAQKLADMQCIFDELKLKVEGYYKGYPVCVNGFSQSVVTELIGNIVKSDNTSFDSLLLQILSLHKQYQTYNIEAAALINKLQVLFDEIDNILSNMSGGDEISASNAAGIRKQAKTLLNTAASKKIKHNCDVFQERISFFESIKSNDIKNLNRIKSVIEKGKIYTDININTLDTIDNQGYSDSRSQLKDSIKDKIENSIFHEDIYIIPQQEYANLPSVRASTELDISKLILDLNQEGFMDDFESFDGIFSYFDNISFKDIILDATKSILIDDYIMTFMTSRMSGNSDKKINNEIEYILSGNASCDDNNNSAEQKILILRFILNFTSIMKDKEKVVIAQAMAAAIAALISGGAGVSLYKYIIISAWAIIDSYIDLEKLLKGESVPIIDFNKNNLNLMQDYNFYLRILLLLEDKETKLLRICDMIEINMKEITGESYKLFGVYNTISVKIITEFDFLSPLWLGYNDKNKREDYFEISY